MKIMNSTSGYFPGTRYSVASTIAAAFPRTAGWIIAIFLFAFLPLNGTAAIISYNPSHLTGSQWKYDYSVTAAAGDAAIDEFTIYFDSSLFANLAVAASPAGWDSLAIQPDTAIPADGFLDSLALSAGITPGSSQSGFSVIFDFLGAGKPGAQRFDIVDPIDFSTISTGLTLATTPPPYDVPAPSTMSLALLALTLLIAFRRHTS